MGGGADEDRAALRRLRPVDVTVHVMLRSTSELKSQKTTCLTHGSLHMQRPLLTCSTFSARASSDSRLSGKPCSTLDGLTDSV